MSEVHNALVLLIQATVAPMLAEVAKGGPSTTDPFGMAPPAPVAEVVTPQMVQELIMPLVANESMKQQLTAEMNAMGINALPEAKPEQLAELYTRFKRVAASGATAASAPAPTSII